MKCLNIILIVYIKAFLLPHLLLDVLITSKLVLSLLLHLWASFIYGKTIYKTIYGKTILDESLPFYLPILFTMGSTSNLSFHFLFYPLVCYH